MKKYCLLLLLCLVTFYSRAQVKPDTIKKTDWLTESIKEKYSVLKSDNKTKQGLYKAIFAGYNSVIAIGNYTDGMRTGVWDFFDTNQKLVESFDYTKNLLLNEEPVSRFSRQYIRYKFDDKLNDSDRITRPVRLGGRCFGYIPYLQLFHLSKNYYDTDPRLLYAELELLISPGGRLADLKVHIVDTDGSEQITSFSPDIFSEADKEFIPATVNHVPVISRIFITCRISFNGTLDVY